MRSVRHLKLKCPQSHGCYVEEVNFEPRDSISEGLCLNHGPTQPPLKYLSSSWGQSKHTCAHMGHENTVRGNVAAC